MSNIFENKGAMAATIVVSASDSLNQAAANYVCDGTADNVEIQAAIDALPAGGGEVVLLDGTYNIAATLTIAKAVVLTGQGWGTVLYLVNNSDVDMISIATYAGVVIQKLKIDGNKGNQGVTTSGIITVNSGNITVKDCYIHNCGYAGIEFTGDLASDEFFIISNLIDECDSAIYMGEASHDLFLIGNGIDSNKYGVFFAPVAGGYSVETHIIGNDFCVGSNAGHYICSLATEISNLFVADNLFEDPAAGMDHYIDLIDSHRLVIADNVFKDARNAGIVLRSCYDITITGNIMVEGSAAAPGVYSAIALVNTVGVVVANNRACGAVQPYGLQMTGAADYVSVTGNNFRGNSVHSVDLVGTHNAVDQTPHSIALDLTGGATDIEVFHANAPCQLAGYTILYSVATGGGAGVNIRVGRYQDGVPLDDDYFDISVSELNKAKGYAKHFITTDLTQSTIAAGDTVTVGTAGAKADTGGVILILKIVEMAD